MKRIKPFIFCNFYIVVAALLFTSCSDFLEKEVQGASTPDSFYKTKYELQEGLNAVYDILQSNQFTNCAWIFGEACGDDVVGTDENGTSQIAELVNFRFDTSNDWLLRRYQIMYRGINRANQLISHINSVKFSSDDASNYTTVRAILGQAKFLRAYFYFELVRTFGGVPIRPETEDINQLTIPRSSKEEVYAYIEKDLREAACMLDAKYTDASSGKVGCGACVALLMKVLMYEATPGEHSDKWEEMALLGDYFITGRTLTYRDILHLDQYDETWDQLMRRLWFKPREKLLSGEVYTTEDTALPALANIYSLVSKSSYDGSTLHYRDLYYQAGEFCSRSVFEIVFKESATGKSDDDNEGMGIMNDLFWNRLWASTSFRNAVANDPRRDVIILLHASATFDNERLEVPATRYGCMKWYTPKNERPLDENDNAKNRRVIIYSDVVLMYAEALNEVGRREEALTQLNRVKAVANEITNVSTLYTAGTYLEMRSQIWTERRIELCHLWDRYFDIVRQGRAATILHNLASEQVWGRGKNYIEGIHELFPIPQTEVDVTNGVVEQNPGY